MPQYALDEVADTLISMSRGLNPEVTNLLVQKLLYYSQAWSLVLRGEPLFREDFEAWVHGPVVPVAFRRFKPYKWNPIMDEVKPSRNPELRGHLAKVLRTYGKFSANELERLTHSESPWIEARKGLDPDVPSHEIIAKQSMRDFYSRKLDESRRTKQAQ